MDFVFDYISTNTYWTILLIAHGLLAIALLGALTHQGMSVLAPVRQRVGSAGFVTRFRAVATIGLGLLPIYWYLWKNFGNADYHSARKWVTVYLAGACWFVFLVGKVVNNVRGFGS